MDLEPPASYFPISEAGRYEVAPGLKPLGTDLGQGPRDGFVFQIDSDFPKFRQNKLKSRQERIQKYYAEKNHSAEVSSAVNELIVSRLLLEHPGFFKLEEIQGEKHLECKLTNEHLIFDSKFQLIQGGSTQPPYLSAFDALASQVQEDIAIMSASGEANWLSAIHLCSPSHWAAEDKIGKDFRAMHAPVAGIENINKAAASFVEAMIKKGPFVRFAWGFGSDSTLNRHPETKIPTFSQTGDGEPYLRVERQVLVGLPKVNAALFTIHIFLIPGSELKTRPHELELVKKAILSMSPESRIYKGYKNTFDKVIAWFDI